MRSVARLLGVIAVLATAVACSISTTGFVGDVYYGWGPESALEMADAFGAPSGERALLDLERAMALLELGRYSESLRALENARLRLGVVAASDGAAAGRRPPWRPELHEAVLIATMEMVAAFGLEDGPAAAAAADRALAGIDAAACEPCSFNFTLILAALAFEEAGRYEDGLEALGATVVVGRADDLVEEVRNRLEAGLAGAEPEGLAPPPVFPKRSAVVILLLGQGPVKEKDLLAVTGTGSVDWSKYLPGDSQAVSWAQLEVEPPAPSVLLTNVEDLAVVGHRVRAERLVASGGAGIDWKTGDLRHWASLPATMQLIVAEVPDDADETDLVYNSPDGDEVYGETVLWPEDWAGGRVYVVRRMP